MVLHQVHDRGQGPNWTHEEARETLRASEAQSPLLAE
jgi:hypothetical protein